MAQKKFYNMDTFYYSSAVIILRVNVIKKISLLLMNEPNNLERSTLAGLYSLI